MIIQYTRQQIIFRDPLQHVAMGTPHMSILHINNNYIKQLQQT